MVVPMKKVLPLGGILTTVTPLQLSPAVTENVTLLLLHWPGSAATTMFPGQLMVGASVSCTVTVKVQELVLPLLSVAKLVTVVMPTGKAEPLGGTVTRLVTPQLS